MKYKTLIIIIGLFAKFANAQKSGPTLKEMGLKGKVKQVIEYTYRGGANVDTLGMPEKTVMSFDESGHEIGEIRYKKNGQVEYKFLFAFPDAGTIVKTQFNNVGHSIGKYIFKYDVMGNQIEFGTYLDARPEIGFTKSVYIINYKYDEKGNNIETINNGTSEEFPNKTLIKCNSDHQAIEIYSYLANGKPYDKILYRYDSQGNRNKFEEYNISGKLLEEEAALYDHLDSFSNWQIETIESRLYGEVRGDRFSKSITKRHIEYFE